MNNVKKTSKTDKEKVLKEKDKKGKGKSRKNVKPVLRVD